MDLCKLQPIKTSYHSDKRTLHIHWNLPYWTIEVYLTDRLKFTLWVHSSLPNRSTEVYLIDPLVYLLDPLNLPYTPTEVYLICSLNLPYRVTEVYLIDPLKFTLQDH